MNEIDGIEGTGKMKGTRAIKRTGELTAGSRRCFRHFEPCAPPCWSAGNHVTNHLQHHLSVTLEKESKTSCSPQKLKALRQKIYSSSLAWLPSHTAVRKPPYFLGLLAWHGSKVLSPRVSSTTFCIETVFPGRVQPAEKDLMNSPPFWPWGSVPPIQGGWSGAWYSANWKQRIPICVRSGCNKTLTPAN